MQSTFRFVIAIALVGLCVTSVGKATENVTLSMSFTSNIAGTAGTWSAYEQNSDPTRTSGLGGMQIMVQASGGVTLTSSVLKLPVGFDNDSLGATGFSIFRSNGVATPNSFTPGNSFIEIHAGQGINELNFAGDVERTYSQFGNQAATVATGDDGSGDDGNGDTPGKITYASFGLPALVAQGNWTQNGAGGTITAITTPTQIYMLPTYLPTLFGYQSFSPDAVFPGGVTIPALPEPTAGAALLAGSMLGLARRRRAVGRI